MAQRIGIPLSVDAERGYAETPEGVKENAKKLLEAGAVGFNIEDGLPDGTLSPLDFQLDKITALVELKRETGLDFVINARTCAENAGGGAALRGDCRVRGDCGIGDGNLVARCLIGLIAKI